MTEWISVKDRLPKGGYLLLAVKYPKGSETVLGSCDSDGTFVDIDGYRFGPHRNGIVTHWMPLSEPPEEE